MTTTPNATASGIRRTVIDVVGAVLDGDQVDPATDLFDQGVTSLAFVRMVARLNQEYNTAFDVTELDDVSIDSLAALVEAQLSTDR
jgi:acyl carrier protein